MEIFLRGQATSRWAEVVDRFGHLVPPFPGDAAGFVSAKVPWPPRLDDYPEREWPLRLVRSYRSAISEWFGPCEHKPPEWCRARFCWVKRELDPDDVGDAFIAKLMAAARAMREAKIAPIAWAAFSCEQQQGWAPKGRKMCRPSIAWVYSPNRLESRAEWFGGGCERHHGGTRVMCPLHKDVIERHYRLQGKLAVAGPGAPELTEELVKRAVDICFPFGLYERARNEIRETSLAREREWLEKVRRDEWLPEWG